MKDMGKKVFSVLLVLLALLFVAMGLRWLVDPAGIAPNLGLTLETGYGLSSQIGDLAAFFLVVGLSILIGVFTKKRTWFYPAAMLLLIAAVGRIVASVVHGADLVLEAIVFEIVVASLVLTGARVLADPADG